MAKKRRKDGPRRKARPSKKVRSGSKANAIGGDGPQGWRAMLPIHPAAELFPLMSPAELKDLAEDIKKNGAPNESIKLWRAGPDAPLELIDGRNRLDALALVPMEMTRANIEAYSEILDSSVDPYAYVVSANIKRRHLNAKQKRELIAELLRA